MLKQSLIKIFHLAAGIYLVVLGLLAQNGRCDFILAGNQELTINSYHFNGILHDYSSASLISGGIIGNGLKVYDNSTFDMISGNINYLQSWGHSTVTISGGVFLDGQWPLGDLYAYEYSTVNFINGSAIWLYANNSSKMNISGGQINYLDAWDNSSITLDGKSFAFGEGLTRSGNYILGSGIMTGQWRNGTAWSTYIVNHDPTATIMIIPEPATLLLLGLGAMILRRRK